MYHFSHLYNVLTDIIKIIHNSTIKILYSLTKILYCLTKIGIQSNKDTIQSNKDTIQSNKDSIQSNKDSIQSNKDYIQSNNDSIQSNKDSIQSNKDSIQSNKQLHDQSIQFLMSSTMSNATYLYDYIQDRDETLRGVEWTHRNVGGETYHGPIFYLGTCKLRLHVYVYRYVRDGRRDANYYVTRLRGDHNDVSDTCHITYVHLYTVNTRDDSRDDVNDLRVSKELKVGDEYWINRSFVIFVDSSLPTVTIRIYLDLE